MQISAEKIWLTAQEHLRVKLSRDTFNMWFAPLRPCIVDGQQLTMEAPNEFCEVWVKDNYLGLLQDAVAVAAGCSLQVKFRVANAGQPTAPAATTAPVTANVAPKARSAEPASDRSHNHADLLFNPKNTFDSFVVGTNNNFAFAAAKAVAKRAATSSSSCSGVAVHEPSPPTGQRDSVARTRLRRPRHAAPVTSLSTNSPSGRQISPKCSRSTASQASLKRLPLADSRT